MNKFKKIFVLILCTIATLSLFASFADVDQNKNFQIVQETPQISVEEEKPVEEKIRLKKKTKHLKKHHRS